MSEMCAADILAIPLDQPHRLFPDGDKDKAGQLRRRLVAKWHPDRNGGNNAVMERINVLFERAIAAIDGGFWAGPAVLRLGSVRGQRYEFHYRKAEAFELGRLYSSPSFLAYVVEPAFRDLAENATKRISRLGYRDAAMRTEHERYMPQIIKSFPMTTGQIAVVIAKQKDQHSLAEVVAHFGGSIEAKHVAWILSSLYNVNCYLKWAGIVHNDIGLHSYFISAEQHNGALLGGWWYATQKGSKPIAVPKRTHAAGKDYTTKGIDSSLIRMTGLQLLGPKIKDAPPPLQRWLRGIGRSDSYDEYRDWTEMLLQAFGARRYAEMKLPDQM